MITSISRISFLILSLQLGILAGNAQAATEVKGTISAKSEKGLQVTLSKDAKVRPAIGNKVTFSTEVANFKVEAGQGTVDRLETGSVWVGSIEGNPGIGNDAVISATGPNMDLDLLDPNNLVLETIPNVMKMKFPKGFNPQAIGLKLNHWSVFSGAFINSPDSRSNPDESLLSQSSHGPDYCSINFSKDSNNFSADGAYKRSLDFSQRLHKPMQFPGSNTIGTGARVTTWTDRKLKGKCEVFMYRVDNGGNRIYETFAQHKTGVFELAFQFDGSGSADRQDKIVEQMLISFEPLVSKTP